MPTPTALVWRSEKPAAEIQYHCLEIGGASGQRSGGSRMKKPCDCCRRYLDHLDAKNQNMICFLRCMTANSKHSTRCPRSTCPVNTYVREYIHQESANCGVPRFPLQSQDP
ncbi:uncharacterized protein LOC133911159 isoform X4 [Phragmites australis]|uniref:uncharacterized protein LOC133911159 isoform X4 n=1 Tax=Phragmites australis TaxID=29695 RepID=UPI002D77184E|nr:uncharacterized protein LOC133911159 isoform X4 [Phragmites australis]